MKTKIIIGMVLVGLLALVLAAPVLAAPTDGNKVAASIATVSKVSSTPGTMMINRQSVKITDATAVYNNMLTIDGVPYTVYSVNTWDETLNLETFTLVQHYKATWLIPGEDSDSGFAGNVHITLYGFNPLNGKYVSASVHTVMQGFGEFNDQTLKLSADVAPNQPWTGYCLQH